jgi:hypothetical protein
MGIKLFSMDYLNSCSFTEFNGGEWFERFAVDSVITSLGLSRHSLLAILKSSDQDLSVLPQYLNRGQVDILVERVAKELRRYYNKQRKNYSRLSIHKRIEYDNFISIFTLDEAIFSEPIIIDSCFSSNIILKESSIINNDCRLLEEVAALDLFDINKVKQYLYNLIYWGRFSFENFDLSMFASIERERIDNVLSILRNIISKIRIKIKSEGKCLYSLFSFFYINFHYHIFSSDEEDHSAKARCFLYG